MKTHFFLPHVCKVIIILCSFSSRPHRNAPLRTDGQGPVKMTENKQNFIDDRSSRPPLAPCPGDVVTTTLLTYVDSDECTSRYGERGKVRQSVAVCVRAQRYSKRAQLEMRCCDVADVTLAVCVTLASRWRHAGSRGITLAGSEVPQDRSRRTVTT